MRTKLAASGKILIFIVAVLALTIPAISQPKLRRAMDFDNDGKADYTIFRPSNPDGSASNIWYIAKSGGGFTYTQFGLYSQDYMTPGDYDNDGKADIAVWRDSTGVWYRLNSSNSTFSAIQFGLSGDEPVARDYDNDGKTDIAVVRRTGGAMIWFVSHSIDGSFSQYQWGLSTDFTAPGDYDGDGKFDYAVQRAGATPTSNAIFFILKSSDGGVIAQPWGYGTDLVVPGDYDGDGKTDIAVVREGPDNDSNLSWYILRSQNGALISSSFGLTGYDITAQNDYDGDGKCDIAVWRNTNGVFYVQFMAGGFTSYQFGQANDLPIASYDTH